MTSIIHEKEMGITHTEFFRLLPIALDTDQFTTSSTSVSMKAGGKSVDIDLGPEGTRQIALLALPKTWVKVTLGGFSEAEADNFMARFDRSYHRGGG